MLAGIGVPSLVMISVLLGFGGATGVVVVVVVGWEGPGAFLDATLPQVCLGNAGGGGGGRGSPGGRLGPAGGGGRVTDWEISLSSSATLVVMVAIFSTRAGSLW